MNANEITKMSQDSSYVANGGLSGALAGGALSAILSALHYGRPDKKKQSFAKRFIKGLLWTIAGAAGGGAAGMGIGRAIKTHRDYEKSLSDAKNLLSKHGIPPRNGRVLLVNYPDNVYKGSDYELIKKIFPNGAPVQHSMVVTMDEDGGNAKSFGAGIISSASKVGKDWGRYLVSEGIKRNDNNLVLQGSRILSGKMNRGGMYVRNMGDALKGKSNDEIAKILADYGKKLNFGDKAEVFEGNRGVNVELPEMFARLANRRTNGPDGHGYEILPGGYNCGTAGRDMFNTVNGKWSHWADMLIGGLPSQNMPSFAKKTTARSYKAENRDNLFLGDTKITESIF